jgi:Ca2+/Na+ antiporter
MLIDLLAIFILITVLLFIISAIMVEENPTMSIIFIIAGMFFTVYCVFGFASIDVVLGDGTVYSNTTYLEAYGWGFFFMFILYVMLFVKAGFNYLNDRVEQREEPRDRYR